jgi:hypothetical protein
MKYVPQIIAALFFLGLVATPIVLKPYYTAADTAFDTKTAIERHGFYVKESAAEIGVKFTHVWARASLLRILTTTAGMTFI